MNSADTWLQVGLLALATSGALLDLRTRRIPNWLTVTGLFAAAAIRLIAGGGSALQSGLLAAGIAFALSFPLFVVRALGGGDVKFLTAVCAFVGWERLWISLAATAIAGGLLALVVAIRQGAVQSTLKHMWRLVKSAALKIVRKDQVLSVQTLTTPGALTVPYGLAIAVGAVVGFYW